MGHYSALKRKKNLIHDTVWMNLEEIMPSETSRWQKCNTVIPPSYRYLESSHWFRQRVERWLPGAGRKGNGSYYLIGSVYLFCKSQNSFAKMWFLFEFSVPPVQTSCEQSCFWAYLSCLFVPLNKWKQWIQDSNPRQLQCFSLGFSTTGLLNVKQPLKSTQPICPQSITNAICNSDYSRHHSDIQVWHHLASRTSQTEGQNKQNRREGWFIRESKWPCALVKYLYNCDSACLYLVKILWQRNRRHLWLLEMSFKFKMETCDTFT